MKELYESEKRPLPENPSRIRYALDMVIAFQGISSFKSK
jgi:hypothetical protein